MSNIPDQNFFTGKRIYNGRDICKTELHNHINLKTLSDCRMIHLLNVMYDNTLQNEWLVERTRTTRNSMRFIVNTDVVHSSIAKAHTIPDPRPVITCLLCYMK